MARTWPGLLLEPRSFTSYDSINSRLAWKTYFGARYTFMSVSRTKTLCPLPPKEMEEPRLSQLRLLVRDQMRPPSPTPVHKQSISALDRTITPFMSVWS